MMRHVQAEGGSGIAVRLIVVHEELGPALNLEAASAVEIRGTLHVH